MEARTLADLVTDQQNAVCKLTLALEGKYKVVPDDKLSNVVEISEKRGLK